MSTSSVYSFDATANRTLVAHFGQDWYITTIASPPEGGVTYGDGFYTSGTPVTVSAIPNPGYDFVNWTESGTAVSTLADYSFTSTSARTLSANFAFTQYSLTTIVQPVNAGTATGAGSYASGNYASIWAGPNSGYVFQQWEMNGVPFSNQQSESIDRPKPPRVDTEAGVPSDAIVLFNGRDLSEWQPAKWKVENGYVEATEGNLVSRREFGDCQLHLEWRTPDPPYGDNKMNSGNSGVHLMGLVEVQIFD